MSISIANCNKILLGFIISLGILYCKKDVT
jgi:hypothetical protein